MPYDRTHFFDTVRETLFNGVLSQRQVDGMNYLLDTWERYFEAKAKADGHNWLAYAFATSHHETAFMHVPLEEYGRGSGKSYGKPTGPYQQCYYGRGHVQLTWIENYEKGQKFLLDRYKVDAPLVQYPHRMLEDETSALVLFDGMLAGWFTGVGLPQFFAVAKKLEDPYNARKIVNALDKAETIKGYYGHFKAALVPTK